MMENDKTQLERFKQAARELGCDDDPEHFTETVRKIAKAPPAPHRKVVRPLNVAEQHKLTVEADTTAFVDAVDEAIALLERLPEVGESLIGLGDLSLELCIIQTDVVSAAGATKLVVRFEPSDLLLRHLAALRARYADDSIVK